MRMLDRFGSDLAALRGDDLLAAIRAAEGRTMLSEIIAGSPPLLAGTANAELAAAFGADLLCLNLLDPRQEGVLVPGLEAVTPAPTGCDGLARLLGRPVGCNLEPDLADVPEGLRASAGAVAAAGRSGAAFVIVTANPGRGARLADLAAAVRTVRTTAPDMLCFAGKMHQAGAEERLGPTVAEELVAAGAHGVLVPVPGTVPGVREDDAAAMVDAARDAGALAMSTIGTSQEGADVDTVRRLALVAKRIGVDIHHIGDAGYTGIASPENLYAYGVAIRGVRHTWNRMARNVRASWHEEEP
jgi:hypothetical protein